MTLIEIWIRTPFSQAMGWTLFHSLWQGLIAAAILAPALWVLRSARSRYLAACLALLSAILSFAMTFVYYAPWAAVPGAGASAIDIKSPPHFLPVTKLPSDAAPLPFEVMLPWTVPFWFAGVLICTLRHLAGWFASRRLRRQGVCSVPEFWQARLTLLGASLRISRPVMLLESCFAEVPLIVGHVRPIVLLPIGLLAGLPTVQIEALLLHELAHIRRCDYLINLFQRFVDCVLFYHPAVWWISGVIREERENCCDDVVLAMKGDALEYAAALTALEQRRSNIPLNVPAATGGSLVKRIRRMLCPTEGVNTAMTPVLLSAILVIAAMIAVAGMQAPKAQAAPVRAIAARSIAAEATPVAQSNNIQASASVVAAPVASTVIRAQASLPGPVFQKWLDEDVLYIITEEERLAFNSLSSDEERWQFIHQFWLRRDPTPATPANEFMDEHYRRIAYANQRFGTPLRPGWATDRGAFRIIYGPPDELESHTIRPGGAGPSELWLYRYIEGKGTNVIFEFADTTGTGDFRLVGPKPGAAVGRVPEQLNARIDDVRVMGNRRISSQTIFSNLQTKAGSELDQAVIANDVKALMSLGFFDEVNVGEERSLTDGTTVIFNVKEAASVRSIEYNGLRSVTIAEINQKLSEAKAGLAVEGSYSATKAMETADVLKTLMASKGLNDSMVQVATERIPPNSVRVIFVVTEGAGR